MFQRVEAVRGPVTEDRPYLQVSAPSEEPLGWALVGGFSTWPVAAMLLITSTYAESQPLCQGLYAVLMYSHQLILAHRCV